VTPPQQNRSRRAVFLALLAIGVVSAGLYGWITWLSRNFHFHATQRPSVLVISLYGLLFGLYSATLWLVLKSSDSRRLCWLVLAGSIAFRLISLPSIPILEIDLYRYIWDGAVVTEGVSPFKYSPNDVADARLDQRLPDDLRRLAELRDGSPALAEFLHRLRGHFGYLPTIYPPVSQVVFALAAETTPRDSGVYFHIVVMKAWLLLFDVGTLLLLVAILRRLGKPASWAVVYGWCPLVLKEFANGGHLDSIAVFLTTLSVALVVLLYTRGRHGVEEAAADTRNSLGLRHLLSLAAAVVLAAAVGAKIYPIVLAPLLLAALWRHVHWSAALGYTLVCVALGVALLWPMLPRGRLAPTAAEAPQQPAMEPSRPPVEQPEVPVAPPRPGEQVPPEQDPAEQAPAHPPAAATVKQIDTDPSAGLTKFVAAWEMNGLLFMLLFENFKYTQDLAPTYRPWFAVTPQSWRYWLNQTVADLERDVRRTLGLQVPPKFDRRHVPFLLARVITTLSFVGIALWFAWRAGRDGTALAWLEAVFLTLAWFFFLSPTQNPWYWTWAMPLLVFARHRAWYAVSGLLLLYYLRFPLAIAFPLAEGRTVWPTGYYGEEFFYFVVVVFEHGVVLAWLAAETVLRRVKRPGDE